MHTIANSFVSVGVFSELLVRTVLPGEPHVDDYKYYEDPNGSFPEQADVWFSSVFNQDPEGWMEFRLSRILFSVGLIEYITRGTVRRTQPPDRHSIFLRLETEGQ